MGSNMKKNSLICVLMGTMLCSLFACAKEDYSAQEDVPTVETVSIADRPITTGDITWSKEGNIYEGNFYLELFTEEGTIYYTLDGSNPETSDTRIKYDEPILITDRSEEQNVISALDPVLISGNYNQANEEKDGFESTVSAPANDAVDKCTVIRAALEGDDGKFDKAETQTYFVGLPEEHIEGLKESVQAAGKSLAVISITLDFDSLFDKDTGIYVKGTIFEEDLTSYLEEHKVSRGETARSLDANYKQRGSDWERPAHIDFFEFDTDEIECVLSQDCGIRIQGNYSRSDLQKGLRLKADKDYGNNNFEYAVFGNQLLNSEGEVIDQFQKLVLRAGGNCAFTAKFNDTYWQSLVTQLKCSTKASRPCVVYVNGEYFGLYVLEEDYDNDYYADHYGVEKDQVIVYKGDAETYELGYKLDEGDLPDGISDESYYFEELLTLFDQYDSFASDEAYQKLASLVDVDSVLDYFAVELWINNKWDWPGKNWSMWKTAEIDPENPYADGRWRFSFYDMEFGGVSGSSDALANTMKEDNYMPNGMLDTDTTNPAVLTFAYLMTNKTFQESFFDTIESYHENIFLKEVALEQLEQFEKIYAPLYPQFFARYPGTGSAEEAMNGGYASISCIEDFLESREDHIMNMTGWAKVKLK